MNLKRADTYIRSNGDVFLVILASCFLFCSITGIIGVLGDWYSPYTHYLNQTKALLRGELALSDSPGDMQYDLAWYDGGLHQVWGLGVPAIRLPFYLVARTVPGQDAFPDRLIFCLILAVAVFIAYRILLVRCFSRLERDAGVPSTGKWHPLRLLTVSLFVLFVAFPPVVALCLTWFNVYEEAVAYEYLLSICLLLGLFHLLERPSYSLFVFLCVLAGIGPFIRPTAVFYGAVTVAMAWCIVRGWKLKWWRSVLAFSIPLAMVLLLLFTNEIRFGDPLEFGHSLNVHPGIIPMFSTRMGHPFQAASFIDAAGDLFGSLFLFGHPDHWPKTWYLRDLFPWQSRLFRWHGFYFTTYDLTYFMLLTLGWLFTIAAGITHWRKSRSHSSSAFSLCICTGLWSFLSFTALFFFYLRTPGITSRYLIDFAPAVVAGIGCLFVCPLLVPQYKIDRHRNGRAIFLMFFVFGIWFLGELLAIDVHRFYSSRHNRNAFTAAEASNAAKTGRPFYELPRKYLQGVDPARHAIQHNGEGWNWRNGTVEPLAVFFISDPAFLRLHVSPWGRGERYGPRYDAIRAKVGLEWLEVISDRPEGKGRVITFGAPVDPDYRHGIQVVFLGFIDKDLLGTGDPDMKLTRLEWR
ncbi:MAG: hypothetical protein JW950_11545 [Deltaproteobacteria bacterium]|nr:hypothetical protein [Deltaproteobacteria bacterium]